jgi:hypothetical protein
MVLLPSPSKGAPDSPPLSSTTTAGKMYVFNLFLSHFFFFVCYFSLQQGGGGDNMSLPSSQDSHCSATTPPQ